MNAWLLSIGTICIQLIYFCRTGFKVCSSSHLKGLSQSTSERSLNSLRTPLTFDIRTSFSLWFVSGYLHQRSLKACKNNPLQIAKQQHRGGCSPLHSTCSRAKISCSRAKNLPLRRSAGVCGSNRYRCYSAEPGYLLLPANNPMRSINNQPEKASLTLCISAHVDSLLLLVI